MHGLGILVAWITDDMVTGCLYYMKNVDSISRITGMVLVVAGAQGVR